MKSRVVSGAWFRGVLVTALVLAGAPGAVEADADLERASAVDPWHRRALLAALKRGETLDDARVAALEERLAADADDLEARLLLLGGRSRDLKQGAAFRALLLGLVERHAEAPVADSVGHLLASVLEEPETVDAVREAWDAKVAAHPGNPRVAGNAGLFLTGDWRGEDDVVRGLALLFEAHRAEPAERRWLLRLGEWASRFAPRKRYAVLRDLLAVLSPEEARDLRLPDSRLLAEEVATAALETGDSKGAVRHAEAILGWATEDALRWDYGNVVHDMHALLGKAALAEGDIEAAKRHLLDAGRTPGSPQLDTFGPDLSLAQAVLHAGARETVVEYLDLCARFWDSERAVESIARWKALVRDGKPVDFRARSRSRRPRPSYTAPVPAPPEETSRSLLGAWESVRSGALGPHGLFVLRSDGTHRSFLMTGEDATYVVRGDEMAISSIPRASRTGSVRTVPLGAFEGRVWTTESAGRTVRKERVGARRAGRPAVEGRWKWMDGRTPMFERYGADARLEIRRLLFAHTGRWKAGRGRLRLESWRKVMDSTYRIRGSVLSLTEGRDGSSDFRWIGETPWYDLDAGRSLDPK